MKLILASCALALAMAQAGTCGAGPLDSSAPAFENLHSFDTGGGAMKPQFIVVSGQKLYGTAGEGGVGGNGTVFAINLDGTGYTNLHSFGALSEGSPSTNSDGANPNALVLVGSMVYGTARAGGAAGDGAIFALSTNGTGFTNLHSFTGSNDGSKPLDLIASGNVLYGTTQLGGSAGNGVVFSMNADGMGFTNLHSFPAISISGANMDGANPQVLVLSNNTLYGSALLGGSTGNGDIFALGTNGSSFTNLYSFTAGSQTGTNADGAHPSDLILAANTLYGTAYGGGSGGNGAVFALRTDGSGFTNLHSFTAAAGPYPGTNSDGGFPAGLVLKGGILYGTASQGGPAASGAVFAMDTNGTVFSTLHSFTALTPPFNGTNADGAVPGALIISGAVLYGAADAGGAAGAGAIFDLTFAPSLAIHLSSANLLFTVTNAVPGATYYLLASGSLSAPLNQWSPVATNAADASESFTITLTNAVSAGATVGFYVLQGR